MPKLNKMFACLLGAKLRSLRQQEEGSYREGMAKCSSQEEGEVDRRQQMGHYSTFLTRELRTEDVNAFQNYLRMLPELFDEILERETLAIERQDTKLLAALHLD